MMTAGLGCEGSFESCVHAGGRGRKIRVGTGSGSVDTLHRLGQAGQPGQPGQPGQADVRGLVRALLGALDVATSQHAAAVDVGELTTVDELTAIGGGACLTSLLHTKC
jgi:hypothetical protein